MAEQHDDGFGGRLRRLREAAGLTQEQLAERAALTTNAIGALERGERRHPYPHTVRALARALRLTDEESDALSATVPLRGSGSRDRLSPPGAETAYDLPPSPTDLIGRERDLDAVLALFRRGERIVTLTGPGGVGKTRLAVRLADELSDCYADGTIFVPLAPLTSAALVLPTIAHAMGLRETDGRDLVEGLRTHLRDRKVLLVLDNLEHVAEAALDVVDVIATSPGSHLLTTSRAPLRVRGEREYPVRPLDLPELSRVPQVEELVENPAVALFVDRAQAVFPGFELARANAAVVAAICRRLDGLPLAIELAAAWIRVLSPTALLARLDRALPLLTGGARDLPARQRTMEQTIGWSYDLLDERHRALFRRLAAFPGGWTLEAAEAVGTGPTEDASEVLGLLSDLVEQSLVTAEPGDEVRYRLLEPVRQYAWQLSEEWGEAAETQGRHAGYFVELARTAAPELKGPDQVAWLARLEAEHDNLRAAMGWLLGRGDMARAASFGYSLWLHWWMRGHFSEGRNWMAAIAAPSTNGPASARAWALLTASVMAYGQGDYEWAAPAIDECLALFTAGGDDHGARIALGMVGLTAISLKEYERGADLVEAAVERNLAAGDTWTAAMLRTYSAAIPLSRGEHAHAARLSEEALALARQLGDRVGVYVSLFGLATVARAKSEHTRAASFLAEALTLSAEMGDRGNVAYCLEALAGIAADRGHPACAASMWAAAEALLETSEPAVYVHTPDRSIHARAVAAARAQLNEATWTKRWSAGRALPLEAAVAEALAFATALAGGQLVTASGSAHAPTLPGDLSTREAEVLRLVASGLTNPQIAERLFLSRRTVDTHLQRIYGKLDVTGRAAAARFASEHGLA